MGEGRMYLEEKPDEVYILVDKSGYQKEYRVYSTPGTAKGVRTQKVNDRVRWNCGDEVKQEQQREEMREKIKVYRVTLNETWERIA